MKKKLLKFLRTITNRYISLDTNNKVECFLVNEGTEDMVVLLGVTEERFKELQKLIVDSFEKVCPNGKDLINLEKTTTAITIISKGCNHPNELALTSFIVGQTIERINNPMYPFMRMAR